MIVKPNLTAATYPCAAGSTMPMGVRAVADVVRRHRSVFTTPQIAGLGESAVVLGTAGFVATGPQGISAWSPPT